MTDVPFTNYAFPASGASKNRTMPARLNDVINVRDWGAKGDGVTDDTAAIQAAIEYGRLLTNSFFCAGAQIFIPAGTYYIGSPPLIFGWTATTRSQRSAGSLSIMGAGRDATILKGNSSGFLVRKNEGNASQLANLTDLTIWNQSSAANSGALYAEMMGNGAYFERCHFKGFVALVFAHDQYNMTLSDCLFTCTASIGRADAATPGPPAGSVGVFTLQSEMVNCRAEGFDVGFAVSQVGHLMGGCTAYRCNTGIHLSKVATQPVLPPGQFQSATLRGTCLVSNYIDRCKRAIFVDTTDNLCIAGNVITGMLGVPDPAPMQSMSWDSGSHLVTVTTPDAHNIPLGSGRPLQLVSLVPPAFTPDRSGTQNVTANVINSTQFTYPGPSASPGSFVGGTWNYPLEHGILVKGSNGAMYVANHLPARAYWAGFDTSNFGETGTQQASFCAAMQPTSAWIMPNGDWYQASSWTFVNCGKPGNAPVAFLKYTGLRGAEGAEFTIIDAKPQPSFGGVVTGGGSNHYKVRYDGTNFIRVG